MKEISLERLLADGFRMKNAKALLASFEKDTTCGLFDDEFIDRAHKNGFSAYDAMTYGITEEHMHEYLSTYIWHKLCPVNDWERIWINDKLTLKYMLDGTEFSDCMPKYYYYADRTKGLISLIDNPHKKDSPVTISDFVDLLHEVETFACKPNNGSYSRNFFKIKAVSDGIKINDENISSEDLKKFVDEHPNFIYTEFLKPSALFSKFGSTAAKVRMMMLNPKSTKPKMIGAYLELPHSESGSTTHTEDLRGKQYNLVCDVNFETGEFDKGQMLFLDKVVPCSNHPETNEPLTGVLPDFKNLLHIVFGIAERFNLIELMGYDFLHTGDGWKITEINSHPGVVNVQSYRHLLKNPDVLNFVRDKLAKIDNLTDLERKARNNLSC